MGFFSVRFSDHHLNTKPFDNQTQIYHLNTKLVQYSDGYCIGPVRKSDPHCVLNQIYLSQQERQWKKAAAKMLAESAKAYVESWDERREKVREAQERHRRKVAGFVSGEVLSFWSDAASQAVSLTAASEIDDSLSALKVNHIMKHSEENPLNNEEPLFSNKRVNNSGTSSDVRENSEQSDLISLCLGDNNSGSQRDLSLKRRRMLNNLKSTLCVSSSDIEIGLLDDANDNKDFSYDDVAQSQDYDDESTIEAQVIIELIFLHE